MVSGGQFLVTFKADPILRLSLLASFLRWDLLSACCTTADPPLRNDMVDAYKPLRGGGRDYSASVEETAFKRKELTNGSSGTVAVIHHQRTVLS